MQALRIPELDAIAHKVVVTGAAPAATCGLAVRTREGWQAYSGAAGSYWPLSAEPIAPSALFDLASVSKSLLAILASVGHERGEWDLQAPLARYLPRLAGTASAQLPLDWLLAHRAGLEPHLELFDSHRAGLPFVREVALRRAANARRPDLQAPSEEGFSPVYSDLGYLLLGAALTEASGACLDTLLARELPLATELGSMRQLLCRASGVLDRIAPTEQVAWRGGLLRGLVHDENAWVLAGHSFAGHAGLFGTVSALLWLGTQLLDSVAGRPQGLWPSAVLSRLLRARPGGTLRAGFDGKSPTGSSAGSRLSASSFGHLGFSGTSLWCDPQRDWVLVLLTNRICPSRENTLLRELRPALHDALAIQAQQLQANRPADNSSIS